MATFDIQEYITSKLAVMEDNILELEDAPNIPPTYVCKEMVIPEPVEILILEIDTSRLVLPNTIRILDYYPLGTSKDLQFNTPPSIEAIIMSFTNIVGKELHELFPTGVYKYNSTFKHCKLNGVDIHKIICQKYEKYFGESPRYNSDKLYNQAFTVNSINRRHHGHIVDKILEYENNLKRAHEFNLLIEEELVEAAWSPHRVTQWMDLKKFDTISYQIPLS